MRYRFGPYEVNSATRELLRDGHPIPLGPRAFTVLLTLLERRDRLVTKDELLELAWTGLVVEENNIQVQISTLRKLLGDSAIKTVHGRGYRFSAPDEMAVQVLGDNRPHNLPRALTTFIGHETDLDDYAQIVRQNRLITLTGAGGCGKTRLAVELASRLLPAFEHGAWFVDLAPIADELRVASTVAHRLHLNERPGCSTTELLCEHLAESELLLVLDNCEHVLGGCAALVQALLMHASNLKVLATSREELGLLGEHTLRVRSLFCPPVDQQGRLTETFEAVRLFVDRARLVQPDFNLDGDTAPAVSEICRRLDGIPLAIELAAARTKVRTVSELRSMMDNRFRLLIGGAKVAPPRQRTLLATIEWSFSLLRQEERMLMERLSVFAGGWTLEGAVAVASENMESYEVLELLTHLVDKSLIASHSGNSAATRYSMLETVREYGLDSMRATGTFPVIAVRHLGYFVELAERLQVASINEEASAIDQLAPELENIVQALSAPEHAVGANELAMRLVAALDQYWLSLGMLELGYRLTTKALACAGPDASPGTRARGQCVAARLAYFLNRSDEALAWANACLPVARSLADHRTTARALGQLGYLAVEAGSVLDGIALYEESLAIARQCCDEEQIGRALTGLGIAQQYLGDGRAALPFFEEALERARPRRDARGMSIAATNVAEVYIELGRLSDAWPVVLYAVEVSSKTLSHWTMQVVLDAVARLATAVHDWHMAARVLGASETALRRAAHKRQRNAAFEASVASVVRNALPAWDFQRSYDAGAALSVVQAIAEAHEWLLASGARPGSPAPHAASSTGLP